MTGCWALLKPSWQPFRALLKHPSAPQEGPRGYQEGLKKAQQPVTNKGLFRDRLLGPFRPDWDRLVFQNCSSQFHTSSHFHTPSFIFHRHLHRIYSLFHCYVYFHLHTYLHLHLHLHFHRHLRIHLHLYLYIPAPAWPAPPRPGRR